MRLITLLYCIGNMCTPVFNSFVYIPGSRITGSNDNSKFNFWRAIILFSMVTTAFGENVPALLNNFSIVIWILLFEYSNPRYKLKRNENIHLHKNLHANVYSSIIHNSQKVETTQIPINGQMKKIRSIHRMEYYSAMKRSDILILIHLCYNIDEP